MILLRLKFDPKAKTPPALGSRGFIPVWGFTLDGNKRQVYNAGTSVQPKWNQNTIVTITKRTLKSLGIHFKEQDLQQYGNSVINTGN